MSGTTAPADSSANTVTAGHQEVVITASRSGYSPRAAAITAGIPTTLIVRSDGAAGCVRGFTIDGAELVLPASGDTRIDLGTPTPGTLRYSCSMGMYTGTVTVSWSPRRHQMPTSTHVFRVQGMHCASCSLLIDDTLEDLPGIAGSQTDAKAGRSTVQLDSALTDPSMSSTPSHVSGIRPTCSSEARAGPRRRIGR